MGSSTAKGKVGAQHMGVRSREQAWSGVQGWSGEAMSYIKGNFEIPRQGEQ